MDEGLPSVSIIAFFAVLVIDFCIHGFGMAIEHLREDEIEKKSKENKNAVYDSLLKVLNKPQRHTETMQTLTIIMNMILGGVCCIHFSGYMTELLGIAEGDVFGILIRIITGFVIVFVIMTFGILLPRRLAVREPEKWAVTCYYPAAFFRALLTHFVVLVDGFTRGLLYVFGIRGVNEETVTEEEIKSMVNEGQEQGVLQETEADMITNIFEFSDKEAQDIMTNRNNMVAIDANMSLKDAVNFMMDTNNSRFPVYLDDIDHIIGIMHIRDAMKKLSEETDAELPLKKIKGLLRHPKFVPETRNIDSLFHNMQSSKTQMVIVIDEYGQTAGLVSMEDILEEIVGNILDEYDEDENFVRPTNNAGEFTVDGKTPLEVLEKKFKISFEDSEFETVNGLMISKLDRIPEEGDEFETEICGYSFKILSVQNHMVESVLLRKLPDEEKAEEDKELEI
ncbi:MAG: hemolysin family protein, partial [Butyrivibrio sp.]|nr:hemolysin family protein [Butyrivibrio sp.]